MNDAQEEQRPEQRPEQRLSAAFLFGVTLLCVGAVFLLRPPSVEAQRVIVGGAQDNPPFEFLDELGQARGFSVDLIRAIGQRAGWEVDIRLGAWKSGHEALRNGTADLLLSVSPTAERLEYYAFSETAASSEYAIFARGQTPPATSFADLNGRTVVVKDGELMADLLSREHPQIHLVRTYSLEHALRLLNTGQADYLVCPSGSGQYYAALHGLDSIRRVGPPVLLVPYSVVGRKEGGEALIAQVNRALEALKASGEYQAISARWLSPAQLPVSVWGHLLRRAMYVVGPLALGLLICLLWSRMLMRRVDERTSELQEQVRLHREARSELELSQRMLIQADRLASLGTVAAGIAHEINTPNGFILLNLPLLDRVFDECLPYLDQEKEENGDFRLAGRPYSRMRNEVPVLLSDMRQGAERVKKIVNDLRAFSNGYASDEKEIVDPNRLLDATLRFLGSTIKRCGGCVVETTPGLPAVMGVPVRLQQVVTNLVLNACEALTDKTQRIRLRTGFGPDSGQIFLEVRDEGVGMSAETLARIASPFFTTKRDRGGTGLGLAISTEIAKEHGGRLEFQSASGRGSIVRLILPVHQEAFVPASIIDRPETAFCITPS